MMPYVLGKTTEIHATDYVFGMEHNGYAMIRKGDWKITNTIRPFHEKHFELYNLSNDLAEIHDLKLSEPEKFNELLLEWFKFSKEIKVQLPDLQKNNHIK